MISLAIYKNLAIGALLLVLASGAYFMGRDHEAKAQADKLLSCQNTVLTMERASAAAVTDSYVKRDLAIHQHETRTNELKNDIDSLAAANQRLQLSAMQTGNSLQRTSTTAKGGKTTGTSADMCPIMLSKCDKVIGQLSENLGRLSEFAPIADKSRNAGLTCEATR